MAKSLNVNLAVTADTSQARAQLQQLQNSLTELRSSSNLNLGNLGLSPNEIQQASKAVIDLQAHLKAATNVNTGNLDFSKLSMSLKSTKSNLVDYGAQLLKMGSQGQQAFQQLTQSIASAEVPINKLSGLFGQFGTVLKNTVRWQISSSLIHGFMGSIQSAFNYAQNLNKSLNNIQIVTGNSNEQMAKFAESANKAAKSLSTTTTRYTDASLIYYQQGIRDDKEIAARTETTIKLANVSGQSAEKVSDQMTAIWNNFAKGGQNLEYYADVITALGAATASSSEEIATGLEKFASIADTVGLSYENASAALATITATTRQSADTVGTGLRTLFSRLQSLSLGETLEDGVNLTKYTKALQTVGVSALDASGNLRSMDSILEDLGSKWDTLTSAQQTALAQTVGGVRQYTTLIALMDNFDFYKQNQQIALNSEGTLQEQADIYAQSWEAASTRVRASAEAIYSSLLNDKFFITLNNGFAGFLNVLNSLIKGLGGVKGILFSIGTIATTIFKDNFTKGLYNLTQSLSMLTTPAQQVIDERTAVLKGLVDVAASPNTSTNITNQQKTFLENQLNSQLFLAQNKDKMTPFQIYQHQFLQEQIQGFMSEYEQAIQAQSDAQDRMSDARSSLFIQARNNRENVGARLAAERQQQANTEAQWFSEQEWRRNQNGNISRRNNHANLARYDNAIRQGLINSAGQAITQEARNFTMSDSTFINQFGQDFGTKLNDAIVNAEAIKKLGPDILNNAKNMAGWDSASESFRKDFLQKGMDALTGEKFGFDLSDEQINALANGAGTNEVSAMGLNTTISDLANKYGVTTQSIQEYINTVNQARQADETFAQAAERVAQAQAKQKTQQEALQNAMKMQQQITAITSGIMSLGMSITQINGLINSFSNALETGTGIGQVFASMLTTLPMSFMGLFNAVKNLAPMVNGWLGVFMTTNPALIAGGIMAAIALIIGAIKGLDALIETPKEKLERLKKEAEEAESTAKQAEDTYNNFISNQSARNTLLDEINKLTQGTQEYINKVKEANDITQDMIGGQGLRYGTDFWYDSEGILQLSQEAEEKIASTLEQEADTAKQIAAIKQLDLENAERSKESEERRRESTSIRNTVSNNLRGLAQNSDYNSWLRSDLDISFKELKALRQNGSIDAASIYAYAKAIGTAGDSAEDVLSNFINSLVKLTDKEAEGLTALEKDVRQRALNTLLDNYGLTVDELAGTIVSNANNAFGEHNLTLEQVAAALATESSRFGGASINVDTNGNITPIEALVEDIGAEARSFSSMLPAFESILVSMIGENRTNKDYKGNQYAESWAMEELQGRFPQIYASLEETSKNIAQMSDEELVEEYKKQHNNEEPGVAYQTSGGGWNREELIKAVSGVASWNLIEQEFQNAMTNYSNSGNYDWNNLASWLNGETLNQVVSDESLNQRYKNLAIDTFNAAHEGLRTALTKNLSDENGEISQAFKDSITGFLNKENITEYTTEQLGQIASLSNTLGSIAGPKTVDTLLKVLNPSNLEQLYNLSGENGLQWYFNAIAEIERTGNEALNSIVESALEEMGGEKGIFSEIFQTEDFQKQLKGLQKTFKKTGKLTAQDIEDIADSCEYLDEALDMNILSAGALADVIELYSMGAITDISTISDTLWDALEAANAFGDSLADAFSFIDEFNPDRSITDFSDFFGKISKDAFELLNSGAVGGERLYQETSLMWNKSYAKNLRSFFYSQEYANADNPEARQAAYNAMFKIADDAYVKAQEEGTNRALWEAMLTNEQLAGESGLLGTGRYYNGKEWVDTSVKEALKQAGFSVGEKGDIEVDTKGRTTQQMQQAIAQAMGIDMDEAGLWLQELAGHSQGLTQDLKTADYLTGFSSFYEKDEKGNLISDGKGGFKLKEGAASDRAKFLLAQDTETFQDALKTLQDRKAELEASGETDTKEYKQLEDQENAVKDMAEKYEQMTADSQMFLDNTGESTDLFSKLSNYSQGVSNDIIQNSKVKTKDGTEAVTLDNLMNYYTSLGATQEQAFETAKEAAKANSQQIAVSATDAYGNVTSAVIDAEASLEEYQEAQRKVMEDMKHAENQELGKDIFAGMLKGIKELSEGESDWAQSLKESLGGEDGISLPVTLELKEGFDPSTLVGENGLSLPTTLKLEEGFEPSSVVGKDPIPITVTVEDNGEIEAAQTEINALNNSPVTIVLDASSLSPQNISAINTVIGTIAKDQPITFKINELPEDDAQLAQLRGIITEMGADHPVTFMLDIPDTETARSQVEKLLDVIPDSKEIAIVYTLPDGTKITTGKQGFIEGIFQANDQTTARNIVEDRRRQIAEQENSYYEPGAWAPSTDYRLSPEQAIRAYNGSYFDTGYSAGSIMDGLPTRTITEEMIESAAALIPDWFQDLYQSGEKPKLTDFYNIGEDGSIALNEAGQALLEAAEAQEKVAEKENPSPNSENPSSNPENPLPNANGTGTRTLVRQKAMFPKDEGTSGEKTSNPQGTNYIESLSQFKQLQTATNNGNTTGTEQLEAQETVKTLANGLEDVVQNIQGKLESQTDNNNNNNGNNQPKEKTEIKTSNTPVELEGKVNIVEADPSTVEPVPTEGELELTETEGTEEVSIPLTGDGSEAKEEGAATAAEISTMEGTITINGDNNGAIAAVNIAVAYANGNTGRIKIDGDPAQAKAVIDSLDNSSITIHVNLDAAALGGMIRAAAIKKYGSNASGGFVNSYVNGSANNYANPGIALTGEEGPEIVWNKAGRYAYIVGAHHPEFANLKPGDRIFNANDTRKILHYNRPKSNWNSSVLDPSMLGDSLFGSYAAATPVSSYTSYGPLSKSSLGGKSGGSATESNKREKDYNPERYHVITRQIQDLTFWYERLKKAREKAYGTNVLKGIEKEIEATNNLVEAQKKYVEEATAYREKDLKRLQDLGIVRKGSFDELVKAGVLDQSGNLLNWEALQEKYRKAAESGEDDAAKEKWDAISQYEETIDTWQDAWDKLTDLQQQLSDLQLEKITAKAEMEIKFDDREIDWLDHFLKSVDDDIYAIGDALAITGSKVDLINRKLKTTDNEFKDILKDMTDEDGKPINLGVGTIEEFISTYGGPEGAQKLLNMKVNRDFMEQLEEISESYRGLVEDLQELKLKGLDKVSEAFENVNEQAQKQIGLFENYSSILDHIKNITGLMNTGLNSQTRLILDRLNNAVINNGKNNIQAQQDYLAQLNELRNSYETALKQTSDADAIRAWQEKIEELDDQIRDAQENLLAVWENTLQQAKDIFDAAVDQIVADFEASMGGAFGSQTILQSFFDKQKEVNDLYLDQVNKYLGLNKLARSADKYINDLNNVNKNIKGTSRLKDLYKEITELQASGTAISEYDLGVLERRLEAEKALADLQNGQNAKSTVRLQRDRNGNWGYVYTNNDDEMEDLQQQYEDKINDLYNYIMEHQDELQDKLFQIWTSLGSEEQTVMEEILNQITNGQISGDQGISRLRDALQATGQYDEQTINGYIAQLQNTFRDLGYVSEHFDISGIQPLEMTDTFEETLLGQLGFTLENFTTDFMDTWNKMGEAFIDTMNEYTDRVNDISALMGVSDGNFAITASGLIEAVKSTSSQTLENTIKTNEEMVTLVKNAIDEANAYWNSTVTGQILPLIAKYNAIGIQVEDILSMMNGNQTFLAQLTGAMTMAQQHDQGTMTSPDVAAATAYLSQNLSGINQMIDALVQSRMAMSAISTAPVIKTVGDTIEQKVEITAEFPNAVDKYEILEAFENLGNKAVQYANKKK